MRNSSIFRGLKSAKKSIRKTGEAGEINPLGKMLRR